VTDGQTEGRADGRKDGQTHTRRRKCRDSVASRVKKLDRRRLAKLERHFPLDTVQLTNNNDTITTECINVLDERSDA